METPVIHTEELTKRYGSLAAAEGINLQINQGEIYGFLGLNGAGKTTTIRMLLGMIRPTQGRALIFGKKVDAGNGSLWKKVGHLVEIPYSYPELTVKENLEIFRRLRFLNNGSAVDEIVDRLNLGQYLHVRARNLSLGNAQRLGFAKAMIHKPELLILDEPANGLDPYGIVQVRELLVDLARNQGVTIFISSHILGEISRFATRIGIIHEGRMIMETETDELKSSRNRILHISTANNNEAQKILLTSGFNPETESNGNILLKDGKAMAHPEKISELLVKNGLPPSKLNLEEEDLEQFFFRIIQKHTR
jgi:ABC-2 type transport system ATP-binding protein